jgi:hypothetical protein
VALTIAGRRRRINASFRCNWRTLAQIRHRVLHYKAWLGKTETAVALNYPLSTLAN